MGRELLVLCYWLLGGAVRMSGRFAYSIWSQRMRWFDLIRAAPHT